MAIGQGALEALEVNSDFWRGKRVLLTGHTGFKGSWLSLWLQSLGVELKGFALEPPSTPSLFVEASVARGMISQIGDIRDYNTVYQSVTEFKPEIVIHMAAQPLVRYSYNNPIETFSTNVMGTAHLLEAIRQTNSVKVAVNITTDKCYENREWVWGYREDEPMGGFDPYSSSKGCSELVTAAYRRSYFEKASVAIASARAGNVIGGGDWAEDRLLPDILRAFEQNHSVIVRNPNSVRPWQHVLEPLSGYLALTERLWSEPTGYAEGWNFGPRDEDAKPVSWIVKRMAEKWEGASWRIDDLNHPHEASYLKLDISKARQRLSWAPRWGLDVALDKIVAWHQAWLSKADAHALCLEQINQYSATK